MLQFHTIGKNSYSTEDEERMGKIKEVVGKLKIGCQAHGEYNRFDKKESQKNYEQSNIELHELGQTFRTVQCNSCLMPIPERLIFCECGTCLRPDSRKTEKLSIISQAKIAPCDAAKLNCSRGKTHGEAQWQRAKDAKRAAIKKAKSQSYKDGRKTRSTANHKRNISGQKATVGIWTPSPRSTSPFQQRTSSDYDTKIRSPRSAPITVKLVR